jgi:hypothetical protein
MVSPPWWSTKRCPPRDSMWMHHTLGIEAADDVAGQVASVQLHAQTQVHRVELRDLLLVEI